MIVACRKARKMTVHAHKHKGEDMDRQDQSNYSETDDNKRALLYKANI